MVHALQPSVYILYIPYGTVYILYIPYVLYYIYRSYYIYYIYFCYMYCTSIFFVPDVWSIAHANYLIWLLVLLLALFVLLFVVLFVLSVLLLFERLRPPKAHQLLFLLHHLLPSHFTQRIREEEYHGTYTSILAYCPLCSRNAPIAHFNFDGRARHISP